MKLFVLVFLNGTSPNRKCHAKRSKLVRKKKRWIGSCFPTGRNLQLHARDVIVYVFTIHVWTVALVVHMLKQDVTERSLSKTGLCHTEMFTRYFYGVNVKLTWLCINIAGSWFEAVQPFCDFCIFNSQQIHWKSLCGCDSSHEEVLWSPHRRKLRLLLWICQGTRNQRHKDINSAVCVYICCKRSEDTFKDMWN